MRSARSPRRLPLVVLAATAVCVLVGPSGPVDAARAGQDSARSSLPTFFGGIQVNEPDHDRWAGALLAVGLDSVQVTLYARQQAWDSATLYWDREAPWVRSEIRAAKAAGLRVMLVMRVALEHGLPENRHLWHGMIWPRDDLVEAWFEAYREFVLWGADMAAAEDVDLFVVGNEMTALTSTRIRGEIPDLYAYFMDAVRVAAVHARLSQCADDVLAAGGGADLEHLDGGRYADLAAMLAEEARRRRAWAQRVAGDVRAFEARQRTHETAWRALVSAVRGVYPGPVTYGANFDQFEDVGFWDALDAMAVTGYFPLSRYREPEGAMRARMAARWRGIAADLEAVSPLPVVLLELGWTRWSGSTVRPYSYARVEVLETAPEGLTCVHWASQPEDPSERRSAVEALADVVVQGAFPTLRGFTLWKLTTHPEHRAIEPFAIVIGEQAGDAAVDRADRGLLAAAARIARSVRERP